jgi:hypothetical protein
MVKLRRSDISLAIAHVAPTELEIFYKWLFYKYIAPMELASWEILSTP